VIAEEAMLAMCQSHFHGLPHDLLKQQLKQLPLVKPPMPVLAER
jgi:hypothetical protein